MSCFATVHPLLFLSVMAEHARLERKDTCKRDALTACAIVITALTMAACGSGKTSAPAPNPTAPTPTPPAAAAVTTVTVSTVSASASVIQLAAMARFSDGTAQDVTTAAQWESSNTSRATVSSTGMVTVVGNGDVDVRATYQNISGTMRLAVSLPPQTNVVLSGVVREVAPAEHPLAGARVDIVEGPNTGKSVVSNGSGAYQFTGLASGQASVTATLDGYIVWKSSFDLSADRQEDLWLTPNPPKNSDGAPATARCKDGTWSWSPDQTAACSGNGGIAYFVCPGPFCLNVIVN